MRVMTHSTVVMATMNSMVVMAMTLYTGKMAVIR